MSGTTSPTVAAAVRAVAVYVADRYVDETHTETLVSHWDDPDFRAEYWAREALDNHGFDIIDLRRTTGGAPTARAP